jgi:DNA-binding transcriptional MerR regulator
VNNTLGSKLYYSISEVAELTQLQPYTLRAWEKEFPCLRPRRARGKNRAYRERDIALVLLIKHLLYGQRYTSRGVRQRLNAQPELVRQAAADVASMLDPAACERLLAAELPPPASRPLVAAARPQPDPEGGTVPAPPDASPQVTATDTQLAALLQLAREELRALLRLC